MSFLTMKNTVAKRCRVAPSGWNTEVIGTYLNECQAELAESAVDWKILEKQSTTSAVVGQANYALPIDWERTLGINIESGDEDYRLLENSYDSIRAIRNDRNQTTDRPAIYAIHYQQLWLAPDPDKTYTIRIDYILKPSDMSSDSDTTVFPEKLLMQYAMAYFKKDLGRGTAEFDREYELYQTERQTFVDAQMRGPDRLDGFNVGLDAVSPYYSSSNQSGSRDFIRNVGDID